MHTVSPTQKQAKQLIEKGWAIDKDCIFLDKYLEKKSICHAFQMWRVGKKFRVWAYTIYLTNDNDILESPIQKLTMTFKEVLALTERINAIPE